MYRYTVVYLSLPVLYLYYSKVGGLLVSTVSPSILDGSDQVITTIPVLSYWGSR